MKLKYEKLVSDYMKTLKTELRHFTPPEPFLDMWVPDRDDAISILNLVESASMHHDVKNLSLELGEETLKRIHLGKLLELLNQMSRVTVKSIEAGIELEISLSKRDLAHLEFVDVPLSYRKKFSVIGTGGIYHHRLQKNGTLISCSGTLDGMTLLVNVNSSSHVVEEASYTGAVTSVSKFLMDQLCAILVHKTVNECYDHAVIRLEYELRDRTLKRPKPGITTPFNSWDVLKELTHLVRSTIMGYRELTGFHQTKNFFVQEPSEKWRLMSEKEKRRVIDDTLQQYCQDKNIDPCKVRVEGLVLDVKLIVGVDKDLYTNYPNFLMGLEFYLKDHAERELTVWTPEESDKNKIRWSDTMKTVSSGGGPQ